MTMSLVLSTLRRRLPVLCAGLALGAVLGGLLAVTMPARYAAETSLVVDPTTSDPAGDSTQDVNITTEQQILGSREVAEHAAKDLGTPLTADSVLLTDTDVAAPAGSDVLQVTVRSTDPQEAADGANALARAYLDLRGAQADDAVDEQVEAIDDQIAELRENDVSDDAKPLEDLNASRQAVLLSDSTPGHVIAEATPPTGRSGPGTTVLVVAGAAAGLLLGVAGALIRERTDRSVRAADRLGELLGPDGIVQGRETEEEFWTAACDRVLRLAQPGAAGLDVRVMTVPPLRTDQAVGHVRTAVGRVLEQIPGTAPAEVTAAGHGLAALAAAARAGDVVLLVVSPVSSLAEVDRTVRTLDEVGTPHVVALAGPRRRSTRGTRERARVGLTARRVARPRHSTAATTGRSAS